MPPQQKSTSTPQQHCVADLLVQALADAAGVRVCFANPGTSEMHIAGALEHSPIRPVLCLHENVATGAADGWARMTNTPATTLLHLGPGLCNGLSNLHNAKRAGSPLINIVGDMTPWLKADDPLLETNVLGLAHTVSQEVRVVHAPETLVHDVHACVRATRCATTIAGSRIATLIMPHDLSWQPYTGPLQGPLVPPHDHPAPTNPPVQSMAACSTFVQGCAAALVAAGPRATMLLGGDALVCGRGLEVAGRIAQKTGAVLVAENAFARADRGVGRPALQRLAYFPDAAAAELRRCEVLVVVGTRLPVPMFGYREGPQRIVELPEDNVWEFDLAHIPAATTLELIEHHCNSLGTTAPSQPTQLAPSLPPMPPHGPLTAAAMCALLVRHQPPHSIIVDESITSGTAYWHLSTSAPPFTHLTLTGGAIGAGPPLALGAALASPGRQVINLQADGSAAYTLQALWSQAREKARVLTIICANNAYRILSIEQQKQGVASDCASTVDLGVPRIDWVALARGFGVPGEAVDTVGGLDGALQRGLQIEGPYLIQATLP